MKNIREAVEAYCKVDGDRLNCPFCPDRDLSMTILDDAVLCVECDVRYNKDQFLEAMENEKA